MPRGSEALWINHFLSNDDRDDVKELVDVMMDFFCIISPVQNNISDPKIGITSNAFFNEDNSASYEIKVWGPLKLKAPFLTTL